MKYLKVGIEILSQPSIFEMESQTDLEKNWTDLQKNLQNYRFTDQMDRFTEKFL